jgi:hypothetical protein
MVMSKFRLNRRAVLKGAGSIAIALPMLEAMMPEHTASAATATTPAKRFLAVYQPGGTVRNHTEMNGADRWAPTGTETAFTLSPILAPLAPVQTKLLIADGFDMNSAVGEQHQSGIIAFLTGSTQAGGGGYSNSPSIDQILATTLSAGKKKPSLNVAVRWATGKSHGALSPINCVNFENGAKPSPIPPDLDPQRIFTDLFGNLMTSGGTVDPGGQVKRKTSILDYVDKRYAALSKKLGTLDRAKIDEHLTKIRELETSLAVNVPTSATCKPPTKVDTTGYNPRADVGISSALLDNGSYKDTTTDTNIPKVGKFMMDMMVMAMACDITGVGTLQWSDTEAKHTFPWLNLSEHHHYYQHDGGFRPNECEKIAVWYSQMHLYLLQAMAAVDMGGHTLLDESVVFFGSELSNPPTHMKNGMPFILAGNGGGMRTGRYVKWPKQSHNNLLVSILNLFGNTAKTVGSSQYCTGPAGNLT